MSKTWNGKCSVCNQPVTHNHNAASHKGGGTLVSAPQVANPNGSGVIDELMHTLPERVDEECFKEASKISARKLLNRDFEDPEDTFPTFVPGDSEMLVTRDAILDPDNAVEGSGTYATSEAGVQYRVVSCVENNLFGISDFSGLVVRIVPTGNKETNGQVKARIEYPEDTGDLAGTLRFNRDDRAKGVVPKSALPKRPEKVFTEGWQKARS